MNKPIYDRDAIDEQDCPEGLIGCPESYTPKRPPREDCALCWRVYNLEHDLPEGNRTARSSYKPTARDPAGHYTRWLPEATPLEETCESGTPPRRVAESIRVNVDRDLLSPVAMGLDLSLTSSGICVLFEGGGDLVAATCTTGFSLSEGSSAFDRQNRLHKIVAGVVEVYDAAVGDDGKGIPIGVEDHAYARSTNQTARLHELHGAVKMQLYVHRHRRPVTPIGIGTARSDVWRNGSADVDDIRDVAREAGMGWLADEVSEDEMESFSVAAAVARLDRNWNTP